MPLLPLDPFRAHAKSIPQNLPQFYPNGDLSLILGPFRGKPISTRTDAPNAPTAMPSLPLDPFRAHAYDIPKKLPHFDPNAEVEEIRKLRGEGKTYREIKRLTKVPHSTAHLILSPSQCHGEAGRKPYHSLRS